LRALKLILGLAAALAVHLVGTRLMPDLPRVLDLFLVVVVLHALDASSLAGLTGGLGVGLAQDALSGRLYGLHGFADTMVGYAVARAGQRLDLASPGAVLVTVALATLLQEATLVVLAYLFTDPEPPEPLWVLVEALVNGVVGALLFSFAGRLRTFREASRRRRASKIRL
jgi:rod shape-determining protein MreD